MWVTESVSSITIQRRMSAMSATSLVGRKLAVSRHVVPVTHPQSCQCRKFFDLLRYRFFFLLFRSDAQKFARKSLFFGINSFDAERVSI